MVKGWGDYLSCFLFSFFLFACLLATLGGYLWFLVFLLPFLFPISFTLFIHIIHDHHVTVRRAGYGGRLVFKFSLVGEGKRDAGFGRSVGNGGGNSCCLIWEFFFSSFPIPIHLNIYYHTLFCLFFPSILIQFFLFYVCKFHDSEGSFFFLFFFPSGFGLAWSGRFEKKERKGESYIYYTPTLSLKWLKLHRSSAFMLVCTISY